MNEIIQSIQDLGYEIEKEHYKGNIYRYYFIDSQGERKFIVDLLEPE